MQGNSMRRLLTSALVAAGLVFAGVSSAHAATATAADTAFTYTGAWTAEAADHYSNDVTTPAKASINFTVAAGGGTVSLRATQNGANHTETVKIDNGTPVSVNLFSQTTHTNATVYTSPTLAAGNHTMLVTVTTAYGAVNGADLSNGTFGGSGYGNPTGPSGNWTMTFDDEFSGSSLDLSRWTPLEGATVNGVTTHASNITETGGNLILTLASASSGAIIDSYPADGAGANGYALPVGSCTEARVSFPGSGTAIYNWPAWWASGPSWPAAGENDIAEGLGTMTVNYHSPSGAHNQGTVAGTWSNAFHIYTLCRKATSSDVYYDGTLVKTYATDDNGGAQALLLNVGKGNTAVYGTGSQVKVDYVRAWAPA